MKDIQRKIWVRAGYELGVSVSNSKDGRSPILLLNGSAFNFLQWENILRWGFLGGGRPNYQIIRYDYGGTGSSAGTEVRWGIGNLVSEIESILDQLAIERVHLFGISMGTIVGQAALSLIPNRVASLAGYGWYFHRYSQLAALSKFLVRRLSKFSNLESHFSEPLTWGNFKLLWEQVYREIVFARSVDQLKLADWVIDWYLQRKLFPVLRPTPIGVIKAWFDYALNDLHQSNSEFDRVSELSAQIPVLVQHAEFDETLPIQMAREFKAWAGKARLIEYPSPFSHLSPAFKRPQAEQLVKDYLDWLSQVEFNSRG